MEMAKRGFLGAVLVLAMAAAAMLVTPALAHAVNGAYSNYVPAQGDEAGALASKVVKFNDVDWYIINDSSTAENAGQVLLFAKDPIAASAFGVENGTYYYSKPRKNLDGLTAESGSFAGVADAIMPTDLDGVSAKGAKLFLLAHNEAEGLPDGVKKCSQAYSTLYNRWWLRDEYDQGSGNPFAVYYVDGGSGNIGYETNLLTESYGVRPALWLDLGKVTFDSHSRTFSVKTGSDPEPEPVSEGSKMHRLYNRWSGEHFYTSSDDEFKGLVSLGWTDEGIGWTAPAESETPVFRLYNRLGGEHHFTTSASEKDALLALGWTDEGTGWYSDNDEQTPVYRQYNPNAASCNHNYTASKDENDSLVNVGWRAEGIGWYGI